MTHTLEKWVHDQKWDVYPIKSVLDPAVGLRLLSDSAYFNELRGTVLDVRWSDTDDPAPAELLNIDASKMVKRLKRMSQNKEQAVVPCTKVDIGGGVLVEDQVVAQLTAGCNAGPAKLARALLRYVFSEQELAGRSLFGGKHAKGAREALDPTR
ncbi:hypothetical protein MTO96_039083, partial [Rhipicephalus appendiculatus]